MTRRSLHLLRTLVRWAVVSGSLSLLLFLAAGTVRIFSLLAYVIDFSTILLITMLAIDPKLARERANPGEEATPSHLRFLLGVLFLLTTVTAAFLVGRAELFTVPSPLRWVGLTILTASSSLQTWAMTTNPFFSPIVRLQSEYGHRLIDSGPYRFMRHPGYLAMCISMPASAVAIGSWLALIPATGFVLAVRHRAELEDQFLKGNLLGYEEYARRVPSGLPLTRNA